jgi:SAM-dependent methyltransferase
MSLSRQMDHIYRTLSPAEIPWNLERPPDLLVELIESGRIQPCRAADLGCGAGNHAVWLATQGFQVTGFDFAPAALEIARTLAARASVACDFVLLDLLEDVGAFEAAFDFAYDWELLHHIFPPDRSRYVANVNRMLRPRACYFSVCFAEDDRAFGGEGKYRHTPIGTTLYFSSEQEIRDLCGPLFEIEDLTTTEISGKGGSHLAVRARLTKPGANQVIQA